MPEVIIKTTEQIEKIREASQLSALILYNLGKLVEPGVALEDIDEECLLQTLDAGAKPAPLNYKGFPRSVCTSVNEIVCHGIPGEYILQPGDIINIDVTCNLDGFFGDTSYTFFCGEVSQEDQKLVKDCKRSLYLGIDQVIPGGFLGDIGHAIQSFAEPLGYGVVREFTGHGTGVEFHEYPSIPHHGKKGTGLEIKSGMIFTIEPMLNLGVKEVEIDRFDTWTVRTKDRKKSAQFEHTILVTENGHEILTDLTDLWQTE
jgi:methionyl aminopeptidase